LASGPGSVMHRIPFFALAFLLFLQVAAGVPSSHSLAYAAAGRTIYVDPVNGFDANPGSSANPYKTLQKALDVATPGTTIKLASGIYQERNETVHDGTADAPIVIEPMDGARPVLDGDGNTLNAIRLVNDYYVVRGLEIRNVFQGVRVEGATGVIFENNVVHNTSHEAVRLRNFAVKNAVRNNTIYSAGMAYQGTGNGEGIYVGTAPEHRFQNGGQPDITTGNVITGNEIYSVVEGIDIKEDASFNYVADNRVYRCTDPNSGGINVRADENYILRNVSYDNAGAGFRFGGDITDSPGYGAGYHYGVNNVLRDNVSQNNAGHAYKFMYGPQDADLSNMGSGNAGQTYYYGSGVAPFVYNGTRPVIIPVPVIGAPVAPPAISPPPVPTPPVSPPPAIVPLPPPPTTAPPQPSLKPALAPRVLGPRGITLDLVPLLLWAGTAGVQYDVQLSRDRLFTGAGMAAGANGLSSTSFRVPAGSLQGSTLYFWRVRATNDLGPSRWTLGAFRTPFGPRVPPLPVMFPGGLSASTSPELVWRILRNEATSFDIQVSTSPLFGPGAIVFEQAGLAAPAFNPAGTTGSLSLPVALETPRRYYWRVRGVNEFGVSAWRMGTFLTV